MIRNINRNTESDIPSHPNIISPTPFQELKKRSLRQQITFGTMNERPQKAVHKMKRMKKGK
mgnify:FL=1